MGIKENLHSKAFWISFGSGASKSAPIVMSDLAVPGLRADGGCAKGTSRATGLPALAMTISSPSWTRLRSLDKRVLAS